MTKKSNSGMIGAIKRSLFIVSLFILAVFSATLWPEIDQGDNSMPVIDGVIDELEYFEFHKIGKMGLYFDNDNEFGYLALTSPGSGWVAIGFLPADIHLGANFFFGAIINGSTSVSDQYGINQFDHEADLNLSGTSDILEYAGVEDSGTVIEFKFKLNSGDNYDKVLEVGNTYSIIVAYNELEDDFIVKHTQRYHHKISILKR